MISLNGELVSKFFLECPPGSFWGIKDPFNPDVQRGQERSRLKMDQFFSGMTHLVATRFFCVYNAVCWAAKFSCLLCRPSLYIWRMFSVRESHRIQNHKKNTKPLTDICRDLESYYTFIMLRGSSLEIWIGPPPNRSCHPVVEGSWCCHFPYVMTFPVTRSEPTNVYGIFWKNVSKSGSLP